MLKAIKLNSFSRVSKENASEASPAGTIKFHYALEGTEEEIASYKEARGSYFRSVEVDKSHSDFSHNGKPLWRTSQILPNEVNVTLNKDGFVQVSETLEEATEKSLDQKMSKRIAKGDTMAIIEYKAKMCAKYGAALA